MADYRPCSWCRRGQRSRLHKRSLGRVPKGNRKMKLEKMLRRLGKKIIKPEYRPPEHSLDSWNLTNFGHETRKALALGYFLGLAEKSFQNNPRAVAVECGVGRGWSLGVILLGTSAEVLGFDSFQGFPPASREDRENFVPSAKYAQLSPSYVRENLRRAGINDEQLGRLTLIEGFFSESLAKISTGVGFVHLDVDLYSSYWECLESLFPRLVPGAVVTFDEYDLGRDIEKWPGAKAAIDKFVMHKNLELSRHESGYVYFQIPW